MRPIIPINDLHRRIPEAGRIRTGVKTEKAMKALDVFRFTSHDKVALEQVAESYGGTVKPWSEPKAAPGQFEVITEAPEIRIVLPPDPLGGSPIYELWSGGGCERRCDGVTCVISTAGPEGPEPTDTPCLCVKQDAMKCDPHTRLNVILPDVRFTGVWRLDSKSWNVAHEFPGFVDLICTLQSRGLTRGVLRLEHRTSVALGKTRKFVVPVLGVDESMNALAAGAASVSSLGVGSSAPALGTGSTEGTPRPRVAEQHREAPASSSAAVHVPSAVTPDDEVIDAEVVTDVVRPCGRCGLTLVGAEVEADGPVYVHKGGCQGSASPRLGGEGAPAEAGVLPSEGAPPTPVAHLGDLDICKLAETVFGPAKETMPRGRKSKIVDECRHALALVVTKGRTHSLKVMTGEEKYRLHEELRYLETGFNQWRILVDESGGEALVLTHEGAEDVLAPFVVAEPVSA